MTIGPRTKIDDLLKTHPFLLDFLAGFNPKFEKLRNPILRRTIGKVANLGQVAAFGDMKVEPLADAIAAEIQKRTGQKVDVDASAKDAAPLNTRDARLEVLKDIIRDLHAGGDLELLKKRFSELIKDVAPAEISEMEQKLIEEGMPEEEVKRLCDIHVQVFKESLEDQAAPKSVPGHPLHTLLAENRALERIVADFKAFLPAAGAPLSSEKFGEIKGALELKLGALDEVEKHYLKKENQLFPLLEAKGVGGPSKVMWAIHDDIRAHLKELSKKIAEPDLTGLVPAAEKVMAEILDMIYKEEKILFPMSLETLDESAWARVKKGEEEIGYAWVEPGQGWMPSESLTEEGMKIPAAAYGKTAEPLRLGVGGLSLEQVDLILKNLPIDISFVDEADTVSYYSDTKDRIFPRTPGVIGRAVQNCHPPKSVHLVKEILKAFREGKKDAAEFWIETKGKFVHIRYFALRDARGRYRGCLEVSQDVTEIRRLAGEKRLLDWK